MCVCVCVCGLYLRMVGVVVDVMVSEYAYHDSCTCTDGMKPMVFDNLLCS